MRLVSDEVRRVYLGQILPPQATQFSDIDVSRYERGHQETRSVDFCESQMRDVEPCMLGNSLQIEQTQIDMYTPIQEAFTDRHPQFCFPVDPTHL